MEITSYKVAEKNHSQHRQLCSRQGIRYCGASKALQSASSENPCVEATLRCSRCWWRTERLW